MASPILRYILSTKANIYLKAQILFEAEAFEDFNEWAKIDRKIYNKIVEIIKDIER
jgi:YoeB-like toxin of bacterial type II toxin-antitoxin system